MASGQEANHGIGSGRRGYWKFIPCFICVRWRSNFDFDDNGVSDVDEKDAHDCTYIWVHVPVLVVILSKLLYFRKKSIEDLLLLKQLL